MKIISTGGLGDMFIVASKIAERPQQKYDWLHVESSNIEKSFLEMISYLNLESRLLKYEFIHDSDYIKHYLQKKWSDRSPVSSGVDNFCPLKGACDWTLIDPFCVINDKINTSKEYDISLQVAAGQNNNRKWTFNPLYFSKVLRKQNKSVALIGTAKEFNDNENDNFVNKKTLSETLDIILSSKLFIGLSGFLSFFAMAAKIPTIHFEIDTKHNLRYIHPKCFPYVQNIKYGSINELMKVVKL